MAQPTAPAAQPAIEADPDVRAAIVFCEAVLADTYRTSSSLTSPTLRLAMMCTHCPGTGQRQGLIASA